VTLLNYALHYEDVRRIVRERELIVLAFFNPSKHNIYYTCFSVKGTAISPQYADASCTSVRTLNERISK
jgi:hypothetical protein